MAQPPLDKVPVTIITGFLGAGKTTLLNYRPAPGRAALAAGVVPAAAAAHCTQLWTAGVPP